MGEQKAEKIELFAYVTPKTKEKLDCLKNLYGAAGLKFSFSRVIEDSIRVLYAVTYLSQRSFFWELFFHLSRSIKSEGGNEMMGKVLLVIKNKKLLTREILAVEVGVKKNFMDSLKDTFKKNYETK